MLQTYNIFFNFSTFLSTFVLVEMILNTNKNNAEYYHRR